MKTILKAFIAVAIACVATAAVASNKDKTKTTEGRAEALFFMTRHDFGFIREAKGPVSCYFEFENVGTAPLVITKVAASCGCTRPEYPEKPIKPGKKGKIKVTYNPIGRPGPFLKKVTVKMNGKKSNYVLYIEGSVIPNEEGKNK